MIAVAGLAALQEKLRRLDLEAAKSSVLERAAIDLQDAVRRRLSHVPGESHEAPWRRSGALARSVSYALAGGIAIVGSDDPVAIDQECGTRTDPPRPFLAPTAAEEAPLLVEDMGAGVVSRLRAGLP